MKKLLAFVMLLCLSFASTVSATEYNALKTESLSVAQCEELKKEGISEKEISTMKRQIEINNFSSVQIENYISSKINAARLLKEEGYEPQNYLKTTNGDTVTPMGIVPQVKHGSPLSVINGRSSDSTVSDVSDVINSRDQTGVYYLVESKAGYDQMTSYLTLPVVQNVASIDRPFHMFGVSSTNGSANMWGDIGLVYFPSSGTWKGFYNFKEANESIHNENYEFSFSGGRNLYFHLTITTSSAILDIINPSSWSVIRTVRYDFATNCVPSNFSTVKISKQITLAQHYVGSLNVNTGTRMTGGQFSQTHLYLTNEYDYAFAPAYCNRAIRQGPTESAYRKVTYTRTAWTSDNVNISFN